MTQEITVPKSELINITEQILTPSEIERQQRTQQLVNLLMHKKNMTQACSIVGISRTTGYEYWKAWQETEEATYINTEWWSLYQKVKRINPTGALKMLTALKLRFHPEKIEIKEDYTEKKMVIYKYSDEDKTAILDAYRRLNKDNGGTPEPISIH